mgnify:CR=1 FL=1
MGNIAFANNDLDITTPKEPDTQIENELIKALKGHFLSNWPLPTGYAMALVNLINKGLYPETLKRYEGAEVYRGLSIPEHIFEENFGPLPKKPKWYRAPLDTLFRRASSKTSSIARSGKQATTYSPSNRGSRKPKGKTQMSLFPDLRKTAVSSWSTKQKIAADFLNLREPNHVSIVLVADSSDQENYFIDADPLYDYDFAYEMRRELEVIGIGDTVIKDIIWYYGT